jgi:alanyl-tRNA synthetase
MATIKRFYLEPDLERTSANILSIQNDGGRHALVLDSTIFYPEGGGQPCDRGSINGADVMDVQEKEGIVYHYTDASGLEPGPAELVLDAGRRRDFSTQHTAQHLLSATFLRLLGAPTVSMHLGDEYCSIDVDIAEISIQDLETVEEAVCDIIENDYPTMVHLCPPENIESFPLRKRPPAGESIIRVLEIDGYDYSPCAGTHLPSTARIGILRILGTEKYKGMNRVSFIAGRRVLRDHRTVRAAAERATQMLKLPVTRVDEGVKALIEKCAGLERSLLNARETAAQYEAERLVARGGKPIMECYGDRNMDEALRVGRAAQKLTDAIIVIASAAERRAAILCARSDFDLRPLAKALLESSRGKGGGGPSFFQAAFDSKSDLDAFLAAAPLALGGHAQ